MDEPEPVALYRLFTADGRLLYVGVSFDLTTRFRFHRGRRLWQEVVRIDLTWFPDRESALAAETEAIKTESPIHNILGTPEHGPPRKYLGVMNILRYQVECGRWAPGQRVPSAAMMALDISTVAPATVHKALRHLVGTGDLVRRGNTFYVPESVDG